MRERKKKFSLEKNVRVERNRRRRRIIMVAASPSLTTNALARMLEERPDPSAFQPVLQIAGNCFVYVFLLLNDTLAFYSSSSKESIHSLRERDRIFEYKRIVREIQFLMFLRSSFPFTHTSSLFLSHMQTSARLRTRPANRNRRRTRDTGS